MNNPITATEAMAKLKVAFPNDYVTVQVEIAARRDYDGTRHNIVQFTCYAASVGHRHGATLETALSRILENATPMVEDGVPNAAACEQIDRLNTEAQPEASIASFPVSDIDAANTAQ